MQTPKGKTIPNRNRLTAKQKKEKLKEELYQYYQKRLKIADDVRNRTAFGSDTIFGAFEMDARGRQNPGPNIPGQRRNPDYGFEVQKKRKKFMTK
jgi:hypothetical protein